MKSDKTIQQKIDALNEKMAWFQSDDFNLDEAAKHYKEIEEMAEEVEKVLLDMKNEIEVIKQKFD